MEEMTTQKRRGAGRKKSFAGTVVKTAMRDTAVVAVTRYVRDPKYKKFVRKIKKYHVHDPGNASAVGERVTIQECAPVSKTKKFVVCRE